MHWNRFARQRQFYFPKTTMCLSVHVIIMYLTTYKFDEYNDEVKQMQIAKQNQ